MNQIFEFCAKYLKQWKKQLIIYIILCVFSSMTSLIFPYLTGLFIDDLISERSISFLLSYSFFFIALSLAELLIGFICNRLYIQLQTKMAFKLNSDIIEHIQTVSLSYIKGQETAYLNQKINSDSNALIIFCVSVLQQIVINSAMVVAPLVLIFKFNSYISIIIIFINLIYYLAYILLKKKLFDVSYEYKEAQSKYFSKLNEQLYNLKYIQMHGAGRSFLKRLKSTFSSLLLKALKFQKINYLFSSVDRIIMSISSVTLLIFCGIYVIEGKLSIGQLTIISSYFSTVLSSIRYFFSLGQNVQENLVSLNRIKEILCIKSQRNGTMIPRHINSIEVNNLTFSFGETKVLNNFSVFFKKGNIYAITGENGAGKSTFLNILIGLYIDEFEGSISYNRENILSLDMNNIRMNLIGVCEQEPQLLSGTLRYNIMLDSDFDLEKKEFTELCNDLGINLLISTLPDGIDTIINEKSSNISSGEKQKIAILRAMIKKPDVLILDEPTSAMDAYSKVGFLDCIKKYKKDMIIIIATHDKDFWQLCDRQIEIK